MRVDIDSIHQEEFYVNEAKLPNIGDVRLIIPRKDKFKWTEGEKDLRSLLCRSDGTVISAGFPKFGNWSEFAWGDKPLQIAIEERRGVRFIEKIDGTLVIRSVIDGHVHFRTRGYHSLGEFEDRVMRLVEERHSDLLDAEFEPHGSLLLEYVGPDNQIVVRYDEPKLFALAHIFFNGGRLVVEPLRGRSATSIGLERPTELSLFNAYDGLGPIEKHIAELTKQEGFVAWVRGAEGGEGWHLVKFKSAWYFRMHALRSEATPKFVREYCYKYGTRTLESFKESLASQGFDWELVSYLEPLFEEADDHYAQVLGKFMAMDAILYIQKVAELPERKDKVIACKNIAEGMGDSDLFHYAITKLTKSEKEAQEYLDSRLLDMSVAAFREWKKKEGIQ